MGDGYDVLDVLGHSVLLTFLLEPRCTNNAGGYIQEDEPLRYSPKLRRVGRDTDPKISSFIPPSPRTGKITYF